MYLTATKIKAGACKVIALLSEEGDEMCAGGPDREWITQAEEKGESGL